jgi:hypothetical protein
MYFIGKGYAAGENGDKKTLGKLTQAGVNRDPVHQQAEGRGGVIDVTRSGRSNSRLRNISL